MSAGAAGAGDGPRRLRADLPFHRIALVLSGGGALGAYEVGVLRVLERLALAPAIVAGVSAGAINAVVWLAHGRRTAALERVWRELRPDAVGLQWVSLALRFAGAVVAAIAALEVVLTVSGSRELSGAFWLWRRASGHADLASAQLDVACWLAVAFGAAALVLVAPAAAPRLADAAAGADPVRGRARLGALAVAAAALHRGGWVTGWPWPHRFSATVVLVLALAWAGSGPGRAGRWLRGIALGLMPETGGRGLWSGRRRRRFLEAQVAAGDAAALARGEPHLIVSALAVDSGRVTHFVNWPRPDARFRERVDATLGEVVTVGDAAGIVGAAVASSALPGVFEPERIGGREFVDAGGFSNQPLHVALADDADAALVVLLAPSAGPAPVPPADLVALGGRLLEVANWRDLQAELRQLPPGWATAGDPARVCVVEPAQPLPAALLTFDAATAAELIRLGERDAWEALARAGWLERVPGTPAAPGAGAADAAAPPARAPGAPAAAALERPPGVD